MNQYQSWYESFNANNSHLATGTSLGMNKRIATTCTCSSRYEISDRNVSFNSSVLLVRSVRHTCIYLA